MWRSLSIPLVITVLAWGFNFAAIKLLYEQMPPAAVGLLRYVPMALILWIILGTTGESLKYPKSGSLRILFIGLMSMGVYMVLFLEGLKRTGGAEGAIILASSPVFTALFAVLAKQELFRPGVLIGALISILGVALVVGIGAFSTTNQTQDHVLGMVLVLLSAVVWAAQAVLSKPILADMSPLRLLALSMPGALIILVPYGFGAVTHLNFSSITPQSWLLFAHVTLLAGVAGFWGFYAGVRQIGPARALLYQYFVPPIAVGFEAFLFGRSPEPLQIIGLILIVTGVSVASSSRRSAAAPVSESPSTMES